MAAECKRIKRATPTSTVREEATSARPRSGSLGNLFKRSSETTSPVATSPPVVASPLTSPRSAKNVCPLCRVAHETGELLGAHLASGKCATAEQKDKLLEALDEAGATAVVVVSVSKGVAGNRVVDASSVCQCCHEPYEDASEKALCTNCTKYVCKNCQRSVQMASYGETRVRVICQPCVDDVRRKIVMFKSAGRGNSGIDGVQASPVQQPPPQQQQQQHHQIGTGVGRGSSRRDSAAGRGREPN